MPIVSKIILFTLAACPLGKNMGTILREVGQHHPSIELETVYVEIDVEITNHYKVKSNPTLLFLDSTDKELDRLEGFHETEEVNHRIQELNKNRRISTKNVEPNKGTMEEYQIFLLKNGEPTSVKVQHHNKTSVKAPRITAIHILLSSSIAGYENPFPKDSRLHSIDFDGTLAKITIQTEAHSNTANIKQMETVMLQTLESFGVDKISLSFL